MHADDTPGIFLGRGERDQFLLLRQANRHGLIAGATGTGKTVTLRVLAEGFARNGVPVFMADVKGDLSGISQRGEDRPKFTERAHSLGAENFEFRAYDTIFWDLYGEQGHPVRATVSEMGPLLLARMLDLNDVQEGILNVAFAVAEAEDLPVLDLKDFRSILNHVAEHAGELRERYGNVSKQSVGAIQRRLLVLEQQGVEQFFGEPELELEDFMRTNRAGAGYISILAADRLMQSPKLYAVFLLWLLSRLFDKLPERGDADKPRLVFFFDEAHLLFDDAPKALVDKVEQVVRLIRSKGVGVYFVTQNPLDIPDEVLGQLGNRVQHALRAFTPRDQKAVKAAASTFRNNPAFDAVEAIQQLAVGEALVSTLDPKGTPTVVDRTKIVPPGSSLTPAGPAERRRVLDDSPVLGKYDEPLDRDSAHERLKARRQAEAEAAARQSAEEAPPARSARASAGGRQRQGLVETVAKSVLRSVGSSVGRRLARSLLNAFFKR